MNAVETELAEGRQGGPDREELNRTDSSSLPPSKTNHRGESAADDTTTPEKPDAQPEREAPDFVESPEPETPESRDPVSKPDPQPKATVEEPRTPEPALTKDPQEAPENEPGKEPKNEPNATDVVEDEGDRDDGPEQELRHQACLTAIVATR